MFFRFIFYLFHNRESDLPQPIILKLYHVISIWVHFRMRCSKMWVLSPINLGAKNMQNLGRFHTTSEFDRQYLLNGSIYPKLERHDREQFLPVWRKSLMNLVYQMQVWTQPNQLFSGDYFGS